MFTPRGFTAFFAVLVGSLALAIGLSVYELLIRELELSQTARESQYAIYASDMGIECALYWDSKAPELNGAPSVFATSSDPDNQPPPSSNVYCNGQDIAATALAANTWPDSESALSATTIFEVYSVEGDNTKPCVTVTVEKTAENAGDPSDTKITSRGHNHCSSGPIQIERALEVNY